MRSTGNGGVGNRPDPRFPSIPEVRSVRRPTITAAVSMCFAVLMTVVFVPTAAFGASRSGSAIPTGFRAQSLSWVTPKRGWILGVAPCGLSTCTTVVGTTDGGGTWNTLGTLNAPLTLEKEAGVTEVRFADALHGWAFWPALWATRDGGLTWRKQTPPGDNPQVLTLAGDSDAVYAVVSPCRLNRPCNNPPTLWRTTATGGSWTQVPVTLPVSNVVVLAMHGVVAYLVVQSPSSDPDVLDVTVDGQQWSSRPDPCIKAHDEFLTDVAPISDTEVALLCVGDPGFSQATKRVLRSKDAGQTTLPAGSTPRDGIVSQIAAAPNGTLMVSSWGAAGSWIYRNSGGRSWTTPVDQADGGVGWNRIVMTTNKVGFVVYGPAGVWPYNRVGELWKTQDGGVTWAPV
jgi:photosystem II stability/assembly factor-like uncharacterized protein